MNQVECLALLWLVSLTVFDVSTHEQGIIRGSFMNLCILDCVMAGLHRAHGSHATGAQATYPIQGVSP